MFSALLILAVYDLTTPRYDLIAPPRVDYAAIASTQASKPAPVKNERCIAFTASWCGPCQARAADLTALAKRHPIKIYDADKDAAALRECGIQRVPLYRVIRDDNVVLDTPDFEEFRRAVEQAKQPPIPRGDADAPTHVSSRVR